MTVTDPVQTPSTKAPVVVGAMETGDIVSVKDMDKSKTLVKENVETSKTRVKP